MAEEETLSAALLYVMIKRLLYSADYNRTVKKVLCKYLGKIAKNRGKRSIGR